MQNYELLLKFKHDASDSRVIQGSTMSEIVTGHGAIR